MRTWRCIMSGIGTPYENMATDEALFDTACKSGVPVLRFYGWTPATASLGFAQRASEALDFTEMDRRHVAWVRRPTGGRAVLHDMEVTYSVSIPQSDPLYALGLEASYEWICGPIVAALLAVGVSATLAPHGSTGFVSASCFTAPGTTDIVACQRKLVGSAQMRTRDGFLQHGSTGGRAVLHDMEVTYSVSIPQSDPLYALGLEASYEWICGPIIAALLAVGVSATLAPHGSSGFVSASCF